MNKPAFEKEASTTVTYEQYTINITQVKMEYAESYNQWLQTKKVQRVIDEMVFKFQLELKKSKGGVRDPEMLVSGKMSHVQMHFTPHVYNNLCNISQLLSTP
jgi:hypothetical protein